MSRTKKIEIPADAKVYEFDEVIEVCLNCYGTGETDSSKPLGNNVLYRPHESTCPVCHGSGRIIKKKTVIIDVKPFE